VSQPGNGFLYLQVRAQASGCSGNAGGLVESDPGDGVPGHAGFKYSYGYVEWRAWVPGVKPTGWTCPQGGCMADWPALWSFPENQETEIDTMEGLREVKTGETCYHFHHHSPLPETHWGGCVAGSFAGACHTFGVDWEPGMLKYYYDGVLVGEHPSGEITSAPQYLIMNDVPEGSHGGPLVVPNEMAVDYVRVWQHPPPPPPAATTLAPSEVQQTSAKLNGSVNPNGLDTHYYFEYGPTTSYGSTVPAAPGMDIGSGTTGISTWNVISGLEPGANYHYRLVASSSSGTTLGEDKTFSTLSWQDVFYRGTDGGLKNWLWNGSSWSFGAIGSASTMAGDPAAIALSEGHIDVFYRGTDGGLKNWYWSTPTWTFGPIGSENAMSGDPDPAAW
jgi:hypothetical protein